MYTVKDMLNDLQARIDLHDLPVLLQKDPEGNGFFWARGLDGECYVPKDALESDRTDEVAELSDIVAGIDPNDQDGIDAALDEAGYVRVVVVFP